MPPTKKQKGKTGGKKNNVETKIEQKHQAVCGFRGPGPIYKLKSVVGYNDHCHSKYRNPAYTILGKQPNSGLSRAGPGPIYDPKFPRTGGFTFGMPLPSIRYESTPGPYMLPSERPTPITMKWRTKIRRGNVSAGPYNLPRELNGPKFTIAPRLKDLRLDSRPGPGPAPKAPTGPAFSIGHKPPGIRLTASPGPYDPVNLNKGPEFTFGKRHGPCFMPFITECDKSC